MKSLVWKVCLGISLNAAWYCYPMQWLSYISECLYISAWVSIYLWVCSCMLISSFLNSFCQSLLFTRTGRQITKSSYQAIYNNNTLFTDPPMPCNENVTPHFWTQLICRVRWMIAVLRQCMMGNISPGLVFWQEKKHFSNLISFLSPTTLSTQRMSDLLSHKKEYRYKNGEKIKVFWFKVSSSRFDFRWSIHLELSD